MKHGDTYITKDGRELMVVDSPDDRCSLRGGVTCDFHTRCFERHDDERPCQYTPIIFVNRETYLTQRLLGNLESSS